MENKAFNVITELEEQATLRLGKAICLCQRFLMLLRKRNWGVLEDILGLVERVMWQGYRLLAHVI